MTLLRRIAQPRPRPRATARITILVLTLLATGVAVAHGSGGGTPGPNPAGPWLITSDTSCQPPASAAVCQRFGGPFSSFVNPIAIQADHSGRLTFFATYVATAHHPGAATRCSPAIFSQPFDGVCRVSDQGTGFIKTGATGLPDFWVSAETATFYGTPLVRGVHDPAGAKNYPLDTGTPMVPGYYDTARVWAFAGQQGTPPRGVYAAIVVTHDLP